MSTDKKLASLRRKAIAQFVAQYEDQLDSCESPIEQLLLATFIESAWSWQRGSLAHAPSAIAATVTHEDWCSCICLGAPSADWTVITQFPVEMDGGQKYRTDFALFADGMYAFDIELDGHDFHERTKEQAARDKARDRAFAKSGWTVIRFTGSEVYRNPRACLIEIIGQVWAKVDPEYVRHAKSRSSESTT